MLLLLCPPGRHSVSIDPTADKQCSLCSIEKRAGSPLTHHIYSAHKTRPSYWMSHNSEHSSFLNVVLFHTFVKKKKFTINNTAKVIEVKHCIYNVSLLLNCNKLNYINLCSFGKVLVSLLFF